MPRQSHKTGQVKSLICSDPQFQAKDTWLFARSLLEWQSRDRKRCFVFPIWLPITIFLQLNELHVLQLYENSLHLKLDCFDVPWISLGYLFPSELFMYCSLVFAVGQMLKIRTCLSNLYGSSQCMWFHCLLSPRAVDRFSRPYDYGLCIHCCHKSEDFSFQYWHVKLRHPKFFHRESLEIAVSVLTGVWTYKLWSDYIYFKSGNPINTL